jgi:hypothetical protein
VGKAKDSISFGELMKNEYRDATYWKEYADICSQEVEVMKGLMRKAVKLINACRYDEAKGVLVDGRGYPTAKPGRLMPLNAAMWVCEMRILDTLDDAEELALRSLLWWVHDARDCLINATPVPKSGRNP